MELTKQDKKHIQERVRKLSFRIVEDAKGVYAPVRKDILRGGNQDVSSKN